jgi:branched-chain amino acid transport system ATP-binding protein
VLELKRLCCNLGKLRILDCLDLKIERGEVVGLIGPNGSGKSTTLDVISGLRAPSSGTVHLAGRNVSRLSLHKRAQGGITRTFQTTRLFGRLTAWQHLEVARGSRERRTPAREIPSVLGGSRAASEDLDRELEFWGLIEKKHELAGRLSFGEQRRLDLARAFVSCPRVLLLDEPAAGLRSSELACLRGRLSAARRQGMAVLIIEHVLEFLTTVADRIAVLDLGRIVAEGTPVEIQASHIAASCYFGTAAP